MKTDPEYSYDLLTEPLISAVDAAGGERRLSLPEILAALGGGEELEFPALQSHQQQAWHAFLVQLAALALSRAGETRSDHGAGSWRELLAALTADRAAWCLLVPDLSRPAFFQPPVPEGDLDRFKRSSTSPEILDVLISAKNHDVKVDRFSAAPRPEHWIYALVTLQTMEGFLGRGNYGISRMNGGFASRPEIGLAPGLGWSARHRRDLAVLLEHRQEVIEQHGFRADGTALLWTLPWSGSADESLALAELDPFYLEICRRVRLVESRRGIVTRIAPTEAARIAAKEQLGNLGDAWTPVRVENGAALTVAESGFHYRLVQELLFGADWSKPPALRPRDDDPGTALASLRVLVRGQGKTGGLHQRQIALPARVRRFMRREDSRAELGVESKARVDLAGEVRLKVLRPALLALGQERVGRDPGGKLDYKDERPRPWLDAFDREVDRVFFDELFRDLEAEIAVEERERRWQLRLRRLAQETFDRALPSLAPDGIHRYRAMARGEGLFHGLARKTLPRAYEVDETPEPAVPLSAPSESSQEIQP